LLTSDLLPQSKAKDNRWIGKVHKINKDLLSTVFILGNQFSLVDIALFPLFHTAVKEWTSNDRLLFSNVVRWFDFVQHYLDIHKLMPQFPLVAVDKFLTQENDVPQAVAKPAQQAAPAKESKQEVKVEEKIEAKPTQQKEASKPQQKTEAKKEEKTEVNAHKEPNQKQTTQPAEKKGKQPAAKAEETRPVDVDRIDIRIGKIVNVERHKDAETLYVEQIDVGEEKARNVVSGLVKFVPIDQMQNRMVAVVCNLKPAKLRGVLSEAMVLAASNSDHTQVELLDPPSGAKPGDRVFFDGHTGEPDKELNPKHKIWEQIQPDFTTNADCIAVWKDLPFKTSTGILKVKGIAKGTIK